MHPIEIFGHRIPARTLFHSTLAYLKPDCVLDVGSRDGTDALTFRKILPHASITAFEANPALYAKMANDSTLRSNEIEVRNVAVADKVGTFTFRVHDPDRGIGSLRSPLGRPTYDEYSVEACRIDEIIAAGQYQKIALWVDTEGTAFEVLEGASGLMDQIVSVHVEVEFWQLWSNQKIESDTRNKLESAGLVHIGGKSYARAAQADQVYVRKDYLTALTPSIIKLFLYSTLAGWSDTLNIRHHFPRVFQFARSKIKKTYSPWPNDS